MKQIANDKLNEGWRVVSNLVYISDSKHASIVCVLEKEVEQHHGKMPSFIVSRG